MQPLRVGKQMVPRSLTDVLPFRFLTGRRFCKASLTCLALLLFLLEEGVSGSVRAGPLPPVGVEDFRALIDPKLAPKPEPEVAAPTLAAYRRRLRQAAKALPSLGEVAHVLLMSEWSAEEFEETPVTPLAVPLDQVRKTVRQESDQAFQRDVQKMIAAHPEETSSITEAIVAEIKREVRLDLLDRLEKRTRFYLHQGRTVDRIAAANLIGDTMANSRRQDVSLYRDPSTGAVVPGVMRTTKEDITRGSRLRQRLRDKLSGDLEKLLADPDTQVRVAAIRALSDLEKEPTVLVALLKPLLTTQPSDVQTRRAAAEALGHFLEVYTTPRVEKDRPQPYLQAVEQVLPVAAVSLSDSDALVRRASLEACQGAALILDDLASDPLAGSERRIVFRPTLAVVDAVLPKINACARDRVPELRVGACRVLETFALAMQKLQRYKERPLPSPGLEPSKPSPPPSKEGGKYKKQVAVPSAEDAPVVVLERPVALLPETEADVPRSGDASARVQPVAFLAPPPDELPPPIPVEDAGIQGVVQAMIENLQHADYRVRLAAVDTLETYGKQAEAAIPALVTALRDYNKFVRWGAARTLGRLSPRQADLVVPGLMQLLDDREDPGVRVTAAKALEQYGEHAKKAVPLLARVINRGDKDYILAILHTLQGIGTDAAPALPNVAWVLSDRTQPPSVRIEAAQTLGRFGALARDQLPVLRDVMLNDPDEDVRNAASTSVLAVERPLKE